MNKQTALRNFVRENLQLLLDKSANLKDFKAKKFAYFRDRLKGAAGMPKNTEIARELCAYCVETGFVNSIDELTDLISKAPFLDRYIYDKDMSSLESLFEKPELEPIISKEEMSELHRREFLERKKEELIDEAGAEIDFRLAEREKQIKEEMESRYQELFRQLERDKASLAKERAEIQKFISEIDQYAEVGIEDIPYMPPSAESTEARDGLAWWERLGLFQNPFPTVDGLSKIDEEYYDELVLKTKIFRDYLSFATQFPDELLNRTSLVVGEFGSGKTTLFDYLNKPMITHDILPILLILDAERDEEAILRGFYKTLLYELAPQFERITSQNPRSIYTNVEKEELLDIMKLICREKSLTGIVLMLDGLHKNESRIRSALKVVQMLQNTKDFWIRKGLNIGLLIAGSKAWEYELAQDPSMRGSINRIDRIQEITVNEAYEMISKRLQTFSVDKDRPTRVRRSAIERVYSIMKKKFPREITFRDMVEEILPHLERKNRGYVEISLPFDQELLDEMKAEIVKFPKVARSIEILRKRPDAFVPALQVLTMLLEKKRVKEKDDFFSENSALFAMLSNVGLIQKAREKYGKGFYWIPSKPVVSFGHYMEKKFKMKPSLFLIDLFQEREEIAPSPKERDEILSMKSLISTCRSSDPILSKALEASLKKFREISEHVASPVDIILPEKIKSKTSEALDSILEVLFLTIESRKETVFFGKSSREWLAKSWVSPSEVLEYWNEIDRVQGPKPNRSETLEITRAFLRAYRKALRQIEQMIRVNPIVDLSNPHLRVSDKRVFHQCRVDFQHGEFFEACRGLTDYMEQRLRDFLFDIFYLKYGKKWRARMGGEANAYVKNQKTRSKTILTPTHDSMNDLYYCTRQHYRPMITEVSGNWDQIFNFCFGNERKSFIDESLQLLFALSDKDKHNLTNEYFKRNSDKLLLSIQQASRILAHMNQAYVLVVSPQNVFIETSDQLVHIYFSFMELRDKTNLVSLDIEKEQGNSIWKRIEMALSESKLTLDLADRGAIELVSRANYRETVGVIGYAIKSGELEIENSYGSSIILQLPRKE